MNAQQNLCTIPMDRRFQLEQKNISNRLYEQFRGALNRLISFHDDPHNHIYFFQLNNSSSLVLDDIRLVNLALSQYPLSFSTETTHALSLCIYTLRGCEINTEISNELDSLKKQIKRFNDNCGFRDCEEQ